MNMYPMRFRNALIAMRYIDSCRGILLLLLSLSNRFECDIITCTGICIAIINVKRGSVLPLLADGMIPEKTRSRIDSRIHLKRQLALRNRILTAAMFIFHMSTWR